MSSTYSYLLTEWTVGQEKKQALLTMVNKVRDIPFQFIGTRDIASMLEAGVGTCNAKHMLLKELAEELGYSARFVIDKFELSDFLKGLDDKDETVKELKEITAQSESYYHTFVQIEKDGEWIDIDITFDSFLKQFGFVVASDFDGKTGTELPHVSLERHIVEEHPDLFKKELLVGESEENKRMRKKFFALLNKYLERLRR